MKKIFFTIMTICLLIPNVFAASSEVEIDFKYDMHNYFTVNKKVSDNVITFTYDNAILDNIDEDLLNTILSQVSPLNSSDVVYYENMKVIVNPILDLEPLSKTNKVYIGQNASWDNDTPKANDMAKEQPLTSNYPIFAFRIQYRTEENGEYLSTELDNNDYKDKTLKQKIAFLINKNENEVIENYNKLYKFDILDDYTYTLRFDFYTESDSEPVLSNDYYYTSSLKLLKTKYVVVNYKRTEATNTSLIINNKEKKTNIVPAIIFFGTLLGGTYILKKRNLIDFSK